MTETEKKNKIVRFKIRQLYLGRVFFFYEIVLDTCGRHILITGVRRVPDQMPLVFLFFSTVGVPR